MWLWNGYLEAVAAQLRYVLMVWRIENEIEDPGTGILRAEPVYCQSLLVGQRDSYLYRGRKIKIT